MLPKIIEQYEQIAIILTSGFPMGIYVDGGDPKLWAISDSQVESFEWIRAEAIHIMRKADVPVIDGAPFFRKLVRLGLLCPDRWRFNEDMNQSQHLWLEWEAYLHHLTRFGMHACYSPARRARLKRFRAHMGHQCMTEIKKIQIKPCAAHALCVIRQVPVSRHPTMISMSARRAT